MLPEPERTSTVLRQPASVLLRPVSSQTCQAKTKQEQAPLISLTPESDSNHGRITQVPNGSKSKQASSTCHHHHRHDPFWPRRWKPSHFFKILQKSWTVSSWECLCPLELPKTEAIDQFRGIIDKNKRNENTMAIEVALSNENVS